MIRILHLPWMAAFLLIFVSSVSEAAANFFSVEDYQNNDFYISAYYTGYTDVKRNDSNESREIEPKAGLELGVRFYYTYNLIFVGGVSEETNESYYGGGLKINLPGYFFIMASTRDFRNKVKKRPVNTSIFAYVVNSRFLNYIDNIQEANELVFGASMDIFLSSNVFLNIGVSTHSRDGDYFMGTNYGLGFEF